MARTTETQPIEHPVRPPRPEELPRHQLARRQRIVLAALAMLEENDYEKIQMREVAERADAALGTVYRYFGSKEHLYAAVMLEWASKYRDGVRSMTGGSDAERLKQLLRRAVRAFEKRPQFFRLEILLESSSDVGARELFDEFSKRHFMVILEALQSLNPHNALVVAEVTNSVLAGRLRAWALGRSTIRDVYAAVDDAVDLIFEGPLGRGTKASRPSSHRR